MSHRSPSRSLLALLGPPFSLERTIGRGRSERADPKVDMGWSVLGLTARLSTPCQLPPRRTSRRDSDRLPKIGPKECVSHRPKQPAVSSWPGLDLPDEEGGWPPESQTRPASRSAAAGARMSIRGCAD